MRTGGEQRRDVDKTETILVSSLKSLMSKSDAVINVISDTCSFLASGIFAGKSLFTQPLGAADSWDRHKSRRWENNYTN